MSNTVHLRGTITHINVHTTSLFMIVREDRANGAPFQVKAFCPQDMKQNPEEWAQNYRQWTPGMRVVIEGSLRSEPEKALNQQSGLYENTRHPVTGKDIFQTYVWAYQMDILAVFEAHQHRQSPPPPTQASRPIPPAPTRAPVPQAHNGAGSYQAAPAGNPQHRDDSYGQAPARAQQPAQEQEQGPPHIPWNMEG